MEFTPWDQVITGLRWNQGEHLTIIAPTGGGKTTLLRQLVNRRKTNIFFGTKVKDVQYNRLINKHKFRRIESIKEIRPWDTNVLLWPRYKGSIPELVLRQRLAFAEALDVIAAQGGWTLWIDEAKYVSEFLKLRNELTFCLEQLRSLKGTVISGAQRPVFLPGSVLSNSTHVFIAKTTNIDDAKRLADLGGIDTKAVKEEALNLDEFEFLYIRTRGVNAQVLKTKVKER